MRPLYDRVVDALSLDTDYLRFNLNEALRELA